MNRRPLVLLPLLLALAGTAQAGGLALDAGSVSSGGSLEQSPVMLLQATNHDSLADGFESLTLTGGEATVEVMHQRLWKAPGGTIRELGPIQKDTPRTFTAGSFAVTSLQEQVRVNLFTDAATIEGFVDNLDQGSIRDPVLHELGLNKGEPGSGSSSDRMFTTVQDNGLFVLSILPSGDGQLTVAGPFTAEFYGVTLTEAASGETFQSGETATGTGVPGVAEQYDVSVVRITATGATFALETSDILVKWTSPRTQVMSEGAVVLHDVRAEGASLPSQRIEGPVLFTVAPRSGDRLSFTADEVAPGSSLAQRAPEASQLVLSSVAGAAVLGSAALFFVLRRQQPSMAEVETCLARGDHKGAARVARRILRRNPTQEDAALARAIALSKAGDHVRVAEELAQHLARHPATDGSLHYVLGIAQLEIGQQEQGRASLEKAVTLTPSLAPEVHARLGTRPPAASASFASAYA